MYGGACGIGKTYRLLETVIENIIDSRDPFAYRLTVVCKNSVDAYGLLSEFQRILYNRFDEWQERIAYHRMKRGFNPLQWPSPTRMERTGSHVISFHGVKVEFADANYGINMGVFYPPHAAYFDHAVTDALDGFGAIPGAVVLIASPPPAIDCMHDVWSWV
jgi:hypothetical protein